VGSLRGIRAWSSASGAPGGFAALYGTDLDEKALNAARTNLESGGIDPARIKLAKADATRWQPPRPRPSS